MPEKWVTTLLTKLVLVLLDVAFVWLIAWTFNPDLTSGTVWFVAFVVGWAMEFSSPPRREP